MKKVRKCDLVELISQYYCNFIRFMPTLEIADGKHGISILINSICIHVIDHNEFDSESDQEACMQDFAKQIEAITFGNLKVTYKGCKIKGKGIGKSFLSWMDIANAYEVVE